MEEKPTVEFPCEYPIKVVARAVPGLRIKLDELFVRHAGDSALARARERPSAEGRFVSVTYLIEAQSEAQIGEIFAELRDDPDIMMVL